MQVCGVICIYKTFAAQQVLRSKRFIHPAKKDYHGNHGKLELVVSN